MQVPQNNCNHSNYDGSNAGNTEEISIHQQWMDGSIKHQTLKQEIADYFLFPTTNFPFDDTEHQIRQHLYVLYIECMKSTMYFVI